MKHSREKAEPDSFPVIPEPRTVIRRAGRCRLSGGVCIQADIAPQLADILADFEVFLRREARCPAQLMTMPVQRKVPAGAIVFQKNADRNLGEEGYALSIEPNQVCIRARALSGWFYGLQTLKQLIRQVLPTSAGTALVSIPCLQIEDAPRYGWRGFLLDTGRHFFAKEDVKRILDWLALYKFNIFHWHLTDDFWRLEIKRYPELPALGARSQGLTRLGRGWYYDPGDPKPPLRHVAGYKFIAGDYRFSIKPYPRVAQESPAGFFYTQADVREIVQYAARRCITVVPEIEMPGHSTVALRIFPQLRHVGIPDWASYCIGREATFEFLQNVLAEVMTLFPGRFIHTGGDETESENWRNCALCRKRMRAEHLADGPALQRYFTNRMNAFVQSHGRRLIGWDEILSPGLAKQAIVMAWRSAAEGVRAAKRGYNVIMTPHGYCYFNYTYGDLSLKKAYAFDPVPVSMPAEAAGHILGGQACLWTERVASFSHVQYMLFPRLCATAEALWSPPAKRDYTVFAGKLPAHLRQLEARKVAYRCPGSIKVVREKDLVRLTPELPGVAIRYTLDGSTPTLKSRRYTAPIDVRLSKPVQVRAAVVKADGRLARDEECWIADYLPTAGWRVVRASSECPRCEAPKAFDGNPNTFWHTAFFKQKGYDPPPHELILDLGKNYLIRGFLYAPRTDSYLSGHIVKYEFYIGDTPAGCKVPAAAGVFPVDRRIKGVVFKPVKGRYIKLVSVNGLDGVTAVGELKLF